MDTATNQQASMSPKERRIVIILVMLGIVLSVFFGFRAVRSYIRLQRLGETSGTADIEAIRGWMTVPYIATAYGLPEEYIFKEIGIPAEGNPEKNLSQLNRQYDFGKKGEIVEAVKTAIRQYQEETPPSSTSAHE